MDTLPPGLLAILLLLLIVFSAVVTLAETSTIAISDARLKMLADEGNKKAKNLYKLTDENPSGFMDAMQLLTNFLGFLISAGASVGFVSLLVRLAAEAGIPVQGDAMRMIAVLVITLVLIYIYLVFGIFLPKRIAGRNAERIALGLSGFTCLISGVLKPFVWLPSATANGLLRVFGIGPRTEEEDVTEEEIRMMVDIGSENGTIDDDEKKMIHNIFELDDKPVEDIMTHRTDVDILWINDGVDKWESFINETNHTRYPVCGSAIDDVIGVLNARDFYKTLLIDRNTDLNTLLRQPYFVPESIKADEMFSQMQDRNKHFAVVLDEYGGFRGIVTQEDLIEEIVGELYSEYDAPEEMSEIVRLDENTWKIRGSAELDDVAEALDVSLCSDEYNTIAGMILDELGTIPEDGAMPELEIGNLQIRVTRIEEHRIEETVVCVIEPVEPDEEDSRDKKEKKSEEDD